MKEKERERERREINRGLKDQLFAL